MSLVKVAAVGKIIRLQLLVGIAGFAALAGMARLEYAIAFAGGVGLMVVNAIWLARRLDKTRGMDPQSGKRSIYVGAVVRFVALIAVLAAAHFAGLHLLVVAGGIFAAQAVVFIVAVAEVRKEQKGEGLG